jgi:hypothetical protein
VINEAERAANAWRRIQRNPTSVVFVKPAVVTATTTTPEAESDAQTVRISPDSRASMSESVTGMAAKRRVVVFGIRNHATLADTDIEIGYRFRLDGESYRVDDIIKPPGEIQALCEAIA